MDITIASDSDQQTWDDIVINSTEGTLFHTWKWLKIMEKHNRINFFSRMYKGKLYPLIVWKGKEIIGLMPVFFYDTPFIKMTCSPPSSVESIYLGPVMKKNIGLTPYKKQIGFHEFQKKIDDFLKNTLKSDYIKIKTAPGIFDTRPFIWTNYDVNPEYTYIIDLTLGENTVLGNFSNTLRNSINRANKTGITVTSGVKEDIEKIYTLLLGRERVNATKEFILEIFDNFSPENVKVFIANKDDILLTGVILVCFKNKIWVWFGTPKNSIDGINPNNVLYWESIRWACSNNYQYFEIIGASDVTTYPFKVKLCGEIAPFYSMKWYSPLNRFIISLSNGLFRRYT
jgi:hypothetical protein